MNSGAWSIWIDTGGTFTDCIATSPTGQIIRLKVLSSGVLRVPVLYIRETAIAIRLPLPLKANALKGYKAKLGTTIHEITANDEGGGVITIARPVSKGKKKAPATMLDLFTGEEVPVLAARLLTQTSPGKSFPEIIMKLGSTRGTNALLERKGARTALLVTRGFKDLLLIGNQQRPDLFTLEVQKPAQIYDMVIEVDERILSTGEVHKSLSVEDVAPIVAQLRRRGIESVAIALLNSYVNAAHESLLGLKLAEAGFTYVSLSSTLSTQLKILPRAQTSLVNAYLDPIIRNYLTRIRSAVGGSSIKVMSSAGGLLDLTSFQPKDSLLSGPAGGVVGAVEKARLSGTSHIITFDMGGTSTDVSRSANKLDYRFECVVGGQRILSPSLAIETIAAGGGSICSFDGYQLCVGPQSAGAQPGPACYGIGGPLTITDVNLLLGRISPLHFAIPLFTEAAVRAADVVLADVNARGSRISRKELLLSFVDIANEKMAEAIRKISVQKGHDPATYSLLSFGGAGGQHACALASLLDMRKILVPYDAGLLSAFGIGSAREERMCERLMLVPLETCLPDLDKAFHTLEQEASATLMPGRSDGWDTERMIFLRLAGQETSLELTVTDVRLIALDFRKRYKQVYGHYLSHRRVEVESIRVLVKEKRTLPEEPLAQRRRYTPKPASDVTLAGSPVFVWESLHPGAHVKGPALVVSHNSTSFVEDGWQFELDRFNNGVLKPMRRATRNVRRASAANLALFTNRFTAIVEDMGSLLQRTSFSVNVKERLDFSCALLDAGGQLIVNAPHIPVHLGSLGVCVREVCKVINLEPGDVVITNHPAFGGSHLPDITLIKPVYFDNAHIGYVVNRAHHAEIGGKKPGSMPADARTLEEEGVIIAPTFLVRKGVAQWANIESLLKNARFPSRSPDENLADLNGGLAALTLGSSALELLCRTYSRKHVTQYMSEIRSHAASLMRTKITKLKSRYAATEYLDDGSKLRVNIARRARHLTINFTGSSKVHPGNLNATTAIVNSVVLYVLRLLVGAAMPLNEGLFEHVRLIVPVGILNPEFADSKMQRKSSRKHKKGHQDPAVVGGNTEVSQRLTDTLLKAFGVAACSQGTMNNLLFGNDRFGYYETICGGAGATAGVPGADAVHTHMTNTRITDPEVLELKYPVRLKEFSIRRNSGGKGKHSGGNGVTRTFVFTDALEVNILSQHRTSGPYGVHGGLPGKAGRQLLIRDGKMTKLSGIAGFSVQPGDVLIVETPGGGGWGLK